MVRREAKSLRKMAAKSAADGSPIDSEVWFFYRDFVPVLAESMAISREQAALYCNAHGAVIVCAKDRLLDLAIDRIEEEGPAQLARMAVA
jgi:hypothetical protein